MEKLGELNGVLPGSSAEGSAVNEAMGIHGSLNGTILLNVYGRYF